MKKQYSISFFTAMIIIALILIFAYKNEYSRMEAEKIKSENSVAAKGNAEKNHAFYLKELNGFVVVYLEDQKTIYEYTTIQLEHLPAEIASKIKNGLKIQSEEMLYAFLEGYSS